MKEEILLEILTGSYGMEKPVLKLLRQGGGHTYIADGKKKCLLKVTGAAFADTAKQSVSIMRYLEKSGFPVPGIILTKDKDAFVEITDCGEEKLVTLMEFIDGNEPDLRKDASRVGALAAKLHCLLEEYPLQPVIRGKEFFISRYLEFLRRKDYPKLAAYEEMGECLWEKVCSLPWGNCHGDLHRGNLLQRADGQIYLIDFDTVCQAPVMFDVMTMCDMTDYFNLKQEDIKTTKEVYRKFLSGYLAYRKLSREEILSFPDWVAIRHFQLQAVILEIYGIDCISEGFIDKQLSWLKKWQEAAGLDWSGGIDLL